MTTGAAFGFHRQVLIHKGTFRIGMAFEANLILRPTGSQLVWQKTAMRIVTVVAAYQFLVYPMSIRPREFRPLFRMTLVAQPGRFLNQQRAIGLGMVGRMTVQTANSVRGMGGTFEISVFYAGSVAGQAPGTGILHTEIFEADDLSYVPPTLDMR